MELLLELLAARGARAQGSCGKLELGLINRPLATVVHHLEALGTLDAHNKLELTGSDDEVTTEPRVIPLVDITASNQRDKDHTPDLAASARLGHWSSALGRIATWSCKLVRPIAPHLPSAGDDAKLPRQSSTASAWAVAGVVLDIPPELLPERIEVELGAEQSLVAAAAAAASACSAVADDNSKEVINSIKAGAAAAKGGAPLFTGLAALRADLSLASPSASKGASPSLGNNNASGATSSSRSSSASSAGSASPGSAAAPSASSIVWHSAAKVSGADVKPHIVIPLIAVTPSAAAASEQTPLLPTSGMKRSLMSSSPTTPTPQQPQQQPQSQQRVCPTPSTHMRLTLMGHGQGNTEKAVGLARVQVVGRPYAPPLQHGQASDAAAMFVISDSAGSDASHALDPNLFTSGGGGGTEGAARFMTTALNSACSILSAQQQQRHSLGTDAGISEKLLAAADSDKRFRRFLQLQAASTPGQQDASAPTSGPSGQLMIESFAAGSGASDAAASAAVPSTPLEVWASIACSLGCRIDSSEHFSNSSGNGEGAGVNLLNNPANGVYEAVAADVIAIGGSSSSDSNRLGTPGDHTVVLKLRLPSDSLVFSNHNTIATSQDASSSALCSADGSSNGVDIGVTTEKQTASYYSALEALASALGLRLTRGQTDNSANDDSSREDYDAAYVLTVSYDSQIAQPTLLAQQLGLDAAKPIESAVNDRETEDGAHVIRLGDGDNHGDNDALQPSANGPLPRYQQASSVAQISLAGLLSLVRCNGSAAALLSLASFLLRRPSFILSEPAVLRASSSILHTLRQRALSIRKATAASQYVEDTAGRGEAAAAAPTYGRFPSVAFDKSASSTGLVFSNGNRTVTSQSGTHSHALLGVGPFSSGKAAWEMKLDEDTHSQCSCVGVATRPVDNSNYEYSKSLWMVRAYNGNRYARGSVTHNGVEGDKIRKGDRVRFELDFDDADGVLRLWINDVPKGIAFSGLRGLALYPAVAFYSSGRAISVSWVEGKLPCGTSSSGGGLSSSSPSSSRTSGGPHSAYRLGAQSGRYLSTIRPLDAHVGPGCTLGRNGALGFKPPLGLSSSASASAVSAAEAALSRVRVGGQYFARSLSLRPPPQLQPVPPPAPPADDDDSDNEEEDETKLPDYDDDVKPAAAGARLRLKTSPSPPSPPAAAAGGLTISTPVLRPGDNSATAAVDAAIPPVAAAAARSQAPDAPDSLVTSCAETAAMLAQHPGIATVIYRLSGAAESISGAVALNDTYINALAAATAATSSSIKDTSQHSPPPLAVQWSVHGDGRLLWASRKVPLTSLPGSGGGAKASNPLPPEPFLVNLLGVQLLRLSCCVYLHSSPPPLLTAATVTSSDAPQASSLGLSPAQALAAGAVAEAAHAVWLDPVVTLTSHWTSCGWRNDVSDLHCAMCGAPRGTVAPLLPLLDDEDGANSGKFDARPSDGGVQQVLAAPSTGVVATGPGSSHSLARRLLLEAGRLAKERVCAARRQQSASAASVASPWCIELLSSSSSQQQAKQAGSSWPAVAAALGLLQRITGMDGSGFGSVKAAEKVAMALLWILQTNLWAAATSASAASASAAGAADGESEGTAASRAPASVTSQLLSLFASQCRWGGSAQGQKVLQLGGASKPQQQQRQPRCTQSSSLTPPLSTSFSSSSSSSTSSALGKMQKSALLSTSSASKPSPSSELQWCAPASSVAGGLPPVQFALGLTSGADSGHHHHRDHYHRDHGHHHHISSGQPRRSKSNAPAPAPAASAATVASASRPQPSGSGRAESGELKAPAFQPFAFSAREIEATNKARRDSCRIVDGAKFDFEPATEGANTGGDAASSDSDTASFSTPAGKPPVHPSSGGGSSGGGGALSTAEGGGSGIGGTSGSGGVGSSGRRIFKALKRSVSAQPDLMTRGHSPSTAVNGADVSSKPAGTNSNSTFAPVSGSGGIASHATSASPQSSLIFNGSIPQFSTSAPASPAQQPHGSNSNATGGGGGGSGIPPFASSSSPAAALSKPTAAATSLSFAPIAGATAAKGLAASAPSSSTSPIPVFATASAASSSASPGMQPLCLDFAPNASSGNIFTAAPAAPARTPSPIPLFPASAPPVSLGGPVVPSFGPAIPAFAPIAPAPAPAPSATIVAAPSPSSIVFPASELMPLPSVVRRVADWCSSPENQDESHDAAGLVKLAQMLKQRELDTPATVPASAADNASSPWLQSEPFQDALWSLLNASLSLLLPRISDRMQRLSAALSGAAVIELDFEWPRSDADRLLTTTSRSGKNAAAGSSSGSDTSNSISGGASSDPAATASVCGQVETLLLLLQLHCRTAGWKCRLLGCWPARVALIIDVPAYPGGLAFCRLILAGVMEQAGFDGWALPDGLPSLPPPKTGDKDPSPLPTATPTPAAAAAAASDSAATKKQPRDFADADLCHVPFVLERSGGFDRRQRLATDPLGRSLLAGAVRAYPAAVADFAAVVSAASSFFDRSRSTAKARR